MRYLNKKYLTYSFLVTCFFIGCRATQPMLGEKALPECEKAFVFIKNEIVENNNGWYEYRDVEKVYEEYDRGKLYYPFDTCLIGKGRDFLHTLLGDPHREAVDRRNNIHTLVYCFSQMCIDEQSFGGMAGAGLIFFMDENNRVKDYYNEASLVSQYRRLDRGANTIKRDKRLNLSPKPKDSIVIKDY